MATGGASTNFDPLDNIDFGDVTFLDGLTEVTVAYWVYHDSIAVNNALYSKYDAFTPTGVTLAILKDGGNLRAFQADGTDRRIWQVTSDNYNTLFSTSQWYHVVYTFKTGLANGGQFYIDGSALTTTGFGGTAQLQLGLVNISNSLKFGLLKTGHTGNYRLDGRMAYVSTYDRILSQDEITEIMFQPYAVVNGLIHMCPLTGSTTQFLQDKSGRGNDGTNNGCDISSDGPPIFLLGGQ